MPVCIFSCAKWKSAILTQNDMQKIKYFCIAKYIFLIAVGLKNLETAPVAYTITLGLFSFL